VGHRGLLRRCSDRRRDALLPLGSGSGCLQVLSFGLSSRSFMGGSRWV